MVSHLHHRKSSGVSAPQTRGFVWNWARRYDLLMGFVTLGREQAFRQRIADLARLQPGEIVLDVGCGTGTLAMVARQRVGEIGRVAGIDPSPQMIARASRKAVRRGLARTGGNCSRAQTRGATAGSRYERPRRPMEE